MADSSEILSINNIFKVYGNKPAVAMEMLKNGADKDEVFLSTGQTVGVFDASFTVNKGEIFVIMGLSGSGKSTLVRLLNRLIEPTSGTINLNGRDITQLSAKELLDVRRKEMSMVFQSFALMPHMTVLENAAFGLDISGISTKEKNTRAAAALEQVGLAEHKTSYPHQLSGGMQQRVGLARALANDPTILLMDEAFSALDPLIRTEMQDELIRLQREQERTVVFISHDLDEAIRIGDRIAIMEGGQVVQVDTPETMLRNPANEYVASFFNGVDVSKVLKAGDIAETDPRSIIKLNGKIHPHHACDNIRFGYLVNERNKLQGIISTSALKPTLTDFEKLYQHRMDNHLTVYTDTPLKDMFNTVADAPYPVPVIDRHGVFYGTISKQQLLQTLSKQ
ncbi:glycine betaine/L-proline ABC transporter ATP-binding protein ProV [Spartinivicinus ruber]|uniref:glycine betaine/L-proline ABC transporter ATP-binding protein ProV n=1 Tax=Spartinivicinus ruber TaxID=2683272 RepID=UPI0013D798C2|nr:glycine betaine/L-proline ABC transporter ATP-binding protein ProV [Spartinivicinus ruber]